MFAYDEKIPERFPTIEAGIVHATGLSNAPSSPRLLAEYRAEQRAASERLEASTIADIPSISAWRRVFTDFGTRTTQYRNAAEALLRRLSRHGYIPAINISSTSATSYRSATRCPSPCSTWATSLAPLTVRFAAGVEPSTDPGSTESVAPDPGEIIFTDDDGEVCARRWCWRQSAGSVTGPATTEALMVIEGHHDNARRDIESALEDLTPLLAAHQPGSRIETYMLSPANPRIE